MRVTLFYKAKRNILLHYYNNFATYIADMYAIWLEHFPIIVAPYSCGFKCIYLDTHALRWHLYC